MRLLISRVVGFVVSLLLTLVSFLIMISPDFFHGVSMSIFAIFTLAILQFVVQSICFLNICEEKGFRWNLMVYVSTISIVITIVMFTIWVMNHLNENMMSLH